MGNTVLTYRGMHQDASKSKRPEGFYFEANNIRISATAEGSTGSVTTERGNELYMTLPTGQTIIGNTEINNTLILFSTDNLGDDNIYTLNTLTDTLTNIFSGDLNFSTSNLIYALSSYENENIQKVYWIDGRNQMRVINIISPTSSAYPELLDIVPSYKVSSPEVESISYGGIHTTGMIQYAYNLIIKNGQQTTVSPSSQLTPLKKQRGGGEVNELVGQINNIIIENVDTKFDIIRLYAIKYTSYNQTPTVSLIAEEDIVDSTFRYKDDGRIIYNISLDELLFLGGTPIIPGTMDTKKNVLVVGDIQEQYFDINLNLNPGDAGYYDTRAYRFRQPSKGLTTVIRNKDQEDEVVTGSPVLGFTIDGLPVDKDHDCINDNFSEASIYKEVKGEIIEGYPSLPVESGSMYSSYTTLPEIMPENTFVFTVGVSASPIGNVFGLKILTYDRNTETSLSTFVINSINSPTFRWDVTVDGINYNLIPEAYLDSITGNVTFSLNKINTSTNVSEKIPCFGGSVAYKSETILDFVDKTSRYLYAYDSESYGATGDNVEIKVVQKDVEDKSNLLKSNEIYRFALEFYNKYGQVSQPHWVVDLKIPQGNLSQAGVSGYDCNTLDVTLNNLDILAAQGVVGWRLLRVERTDQDKTIVTQGILNPTFFQYYDENTASDITGLMFRNTSINIETDGFTPDLRDPDKDIDPKVSDTDDRCSDNALKLPSPFIRTMGRFMDGYFSAIKSASEMTPYIKIEGIKHGYPISGKSHDGNANVFDSNANDPRFEIYRTNANGSTNAISNLDTRLITFNSPELIFLNPSFSANMRLKLNHFVIGSRDTVEAWGKQSDKSTQLEISNAFKRGGLDLFHVNVETGQEFNNSGKIGGSGQELFCQYQYYRPFTFVNYAKDNYYNIKGTPTIVGTGENNVVYDADITNLAAKYKYSNNLFSVVADKNTQEGTEQLQTSLVSVSTIGIKNALLLIDDNNGGEEYLENILEADFPSERVRQATINPISGIYGTFPATLADKQYSIGIAELIRTLSNQYGGNTYESRSRNSYLRVSKYYDISGYSSNSMTKSIVRAGDTFVNIFSFARLLPNVATVYSDKYQQNTEIVEFPLETSINLACRSDYSVTGWNTKFQPSFNEYHAYNRVYSQEPIATQNIANPFTFEPVTYNSNKVTAAKIKTSGELIDSWTDILVNEELTLDGKYGKLVKLISNNGSIYAFQEKAIAQLQVQPRIQQVTSDGQGVELGTGQILYNYEYLTTSSGCVNKRAIFTSPSSIYYLDLINKSFNRLGQNGLEGLSDAAGLHTFFINNLDYDTQRFSNSVHGVFDAINNDAFITISGDFTLAFNEKTNSFTSFYNGFKDADRYLISTDGLYSTAGANTIWLHGNGDYGKFYNNPVEDSYITFIVAPNTVKESVFNNLKFYAELTDSNGDDVFNNNDVITLPFKSMQCWNNYQDSGEIGFTYKSNLYRKFREWNVVLPRDSVKRRDRLRGEWLYIKLKIDNTDNNTLILHDVVTIYT